MRCMHQSASAKMGCIDTGPVIARAAQKTQAPPEPVQSAHATPPGPARSAHGAHGLISQSTAQHRTRAPPGPARSGR